MTNKKTKKQKPKKAAKRPSPKGRPPIALTEAPPKKAAAAAAGTVILPKAQPKKGFPIVGIGASAGGLAAFEAFFSGMPADIDPGMAFVLVQHLSPDHKSILTDILRRYTRMKVFEVKDGMTVQPNCIYIIPPNRDIAFLNGTLHLMEQTSRRGQRLPIDFFFRSLAQDQHERAEEELQESERMYQDLYDNAPDMYASVDPTTACIVRCNQTLARATGYTKDEIIGKPIFEMYHPDCIEEMKKAFQLFTSSGEIRDTELVARRKDGSKFEVSLSVSAVRDATGKIIFSRSSWRDITERKRAEEALRESNEKFQLAINATEDGLWEWDIQTNQEFFAPRWCEIIGYSVDDPEFPHTFKSWVSRIHPDDYDRVTDALNNHLKNGVKYDVDYRHRHKSGEYRWQNSKGQAIFDASGKPAKMVGCIRDITGRKRAEEAIHRNAKELQEKNDELNRFTYAVSHDLKSPLVTIRTFQGHLEQDVRSQDAARIEMDLGYIRNAADKMSRLLDELLRLSRVGRMMNPSEEAPLQEIVKEALDLVAGRITGRGVRVDLTEEPVVLYGDRTRLIEIFMNLVDNAVKFMGDQPAPRVEIGVEQVGEELALHVRDNGIGIDPELQSLVFGLFHKLDPGSEGEGIGLALVRRIVELHGGRIWVESEGPGKGTTFRFTLAKTRRGVDREERT